MVFRLQAHVAILVIDALERRLIADEGDDDVAILGPFLAVDDDDVAIQYARLDHAFALHAQREKLCIHGGEIVGNDELIFDVLNGENGLPGRDFSHQRHGARLGQGAVEQFQRPGLGGVAADEAFLFQLCQVHMHRRRGAQAHGSAYLAHRGGIALGLDLAADKIQYLLLILPARTHGTYPPYLYLRLL